MTVLSSKRVLEEKSTSDGSSITSLKLTLRALSDVSCLSEFKNLEKLDLSFNNLIALESLKSCVSLKWLSVANNNLHSLKGIESLCKLTVLNAGKNKLKSITEVETLTNMRALILNDNEISSVSNLHNMKELNTLVLSRNPISSLPESLRKHKSITKLSLSNCKLSSINSSITSCLQMKELRLAHNEIRTIPEELRKLVKLQNLDLGNNLISNSSSIKVLSSLVNLRNLNLQGNPIAEREKLLKKVKKMLPNLHIFNARPINKIPGKERVDKADGSVDEAEMGQSGEAQYLNRTMDNSLHNVENSGHREKVKELKQTKGEDDVDGRKISEKSMRKNLKEAKKPRQSSGIEDTEKNDTKSKKNLKRGNASEIDSAEVSFTDLFASVPPEASLEAADVKLNSKSNDMVGFVGVKPTKKKKSKQIVKPVVSELLQAEEIGLGGPSAWDQM